MQEIVTSIKKPKNIISIEDCKFDGNKIYIYKMHDGSIRMLVEFQRTYHWSNFCLSNKGCYGYSHGGYTTAKEAVEDCLDTAEYKSIYVFDSQCELKEWAS